MSRLLLALCLLLGCASTPSKPVVLTERELLIRSALVFAVGAVIGGAASLAVQKVCKCP